MKHTPLSIQKVLSEIGQRIPQTLRDNLIEKVKSTPTIEKVVDEALKKKDLRPELREKLQTLKDSGEFSRVRERINPTVQRIYDQFINREIAKEVRRGRLPKNPRKYLYGQKNSGEGS